MHHFNLPHRKYECLVCVYEVFEKFISVIPRKIHVLASF